MIIQTRLFGEIEIEDEKILTFPSGLIGMKHLKRFVILDTEKEKPFRWMVSLDDQNVSFLTIEPQVFRPDYRVSLQKEEFKQLGLSRSCEVLVLSVVTLYKNPRNLTANLQGPLIINAENRIGKQIILVDGRYNTRHDILAEMKEKSVTGGTPDQSNMVEVRNSK